MNLRRRRAFSLLEVLLATAILIGSAIVLMELGTIGGRHAASARDLTKSQLICQTKLDEILAHVVPAEAVRPTPVEDDPDWVYWIDIQPLKQPGLALVEVSAARGSRVAQQSEKQTARFTLARWIRDPQMSRSSDPSATPPDPNATAGGFQPGLVP